MNSYTHGKNKNATYRAIVCGILVQQAVGRVVLLKVLTSDRRPENHLEAAHDEF
jgi:hypothetical protein